MRWVFSEMLTGSHMGCFQDDGLSAVTTQEARMFGACVEVALSRLV